MADDEPAAPLEFKGPTGKISNMFNHYVQRIRGLPTEQERLDMELEEDVSNNTWGARVLPWAWFRSPDAIGGLTAKPRAYFEMKEAWVEHVSSALDIRIGNQIIAWGAADQINPTDVWNAWDLYDPIQSNKLPVTVAKMKLHPPEFEQFALEVIGTPIFRESRLPITLPSGATIDVPLTGSRWLLPVPSSFIAGGLNAPLFYKVSEPSYPATWQLGGRLSVLRVGGWDFSASGYSGVEHLPRFAVTRKGSATDPNLPVTLTLNPSFHRMNMYGVDGSGSFSIGKRDVGARFEMAYVQRNNSRASSAEPDFQADLIKDDYFQGVWGIDYTFPQKILGAVLYTNLQYTFYHRIEGNEQRPGATVIEGLPNVNPWDSDLVFYVEDRFSSTVKLTANMIYSLQNADAYVCPGFSVNWTDNLKTTLSGDLFLGSERGFFGQFQDNKRVNFAASYAF